MRLHLASLLVLATACGGPPAPPQAPLQSHHVAPQPTTPAPTVQWIDNGFDANLLPAVTHDGSTVVLAIQDSDGGRGYPNLRLALRDRRDAESKSFSVLATSEVETFFDAGKHPKLDDRIVAANGWLTQLHRARTLRPLLELEVIQPGDELGRATLAVRETIRVTWQDSSLRITEGDTPVVSITTPKTWLTEDTKLCPTCSEMCSNPAFLAAAAVDPARKIAVIRVGYTGTDTCWEPPDQQHVVAW